MASLSDDNKDDIIKAFNSTSRYSDNLLNIDNPYFKGMVNQIYPPELQLNKANTSDTEAPYSDLHLSFSNGFVSSQIYDKCNDFDLIKGKLKLAQHVCATCLLKDKQKLGHPEC